MGSFKISTSSWHWKMYMFAVAMWAKFLNNPLWGYETPNLCAYLRMILLYQPIVLILNLAIYASPLWVGMLLGHYYGYWIIIEILPYLWKVLAVIGWFALAAGVIFGIAFIGNFFENRSTKKNRIQKEPTESSEKSFTHVVLQGISDKHDMFCRPIVPVTPEIITQPQPTSIEQEGAQEGTEVEEPLHIEPEKEESSSYVLMTYKVALTLGKMIILSVAIALSGWGLWYAADSAASKESLVPREMCRVVESKITGFGETNGKGASIEVHAACSFGSVTEKSSSVGETIAFAMTKPTDLPCYTKKYKYATVSGCDLPK